MASSSSRSKSHPRSRTNRYTTKARAASSGYNSTWNSMRCQVARSRVPYHAPSVCSVCTKARKAPGQCAKYSTVASTGTTEPTADHSSTPRQRCRSRHSTTASSATGSSTANGLIAQHQPATARQPAIHRASRHSTASAAHAIAISHSAAISQSRSAVLNAASFRCNAQVNKAPAAPAIAAAKRRDSRSGDGMRTAVITAPGGPYVSAGPNVPKVPSTPGDPCSPAGSKQADGRVPAPQPGSACTKDVHAQPLAHQRARQVHLDHAGIRRMARADHEHHVVHDGRVVHNRPQARVQHQPHQAIHQRQQQRVENQQRQVNAPRSAFRQRRGRPAACSIAAAVTSLRTAPRDILFSAQAARPFQTAASLPRPSGGRCCATRSGRRP